MRPWICSLWNIWPKRPLREAFLAQNTILTAQKAPAGRLSDLQNIKQYVSWYIFRLWYMKSEAFRYYKSFEHSPKPSKHAKYTVFNDSYVEKISFSKKCRKSILTGAKIRKKYAEFESAVHLAWNLQKWWVFDDFHFCIFFIFAFFYILGSAAWGFSL